MRRQTAWGAELIKFLDGLAISILHQDNLICRMNSFFFKLSWCKTASRAWKWINSVHQTAATTFAFSSICFLLLWRVFKLQDAPVGNKNKKIDGHAKETLLLVCRRASCTCWLTARFVGTWAAATTSSWCTPPGAVTARISNPRGSRWAWHFFSQIEFMQKMAWTGTLRLTLNSSANEAK